MGLKKCNPNLPYSYGKVKRERSEVGPSFAQKFFQRTLSQKCENDSFSEFFYHFPRIQSINMDIFLKISNSKPKLILRAPPPGIREKRVLLSGGEGGGGGAMVSCATKKRGKRSKN